eukprot:2077-Chlamydomonas_euryale.AAC.8
MATALCRLVACKASTLERWVQVYGAKRHGKGYKAKKRRAVERCARGRSNACECKPLRGCPCMHRRAAHACVKGLCAEPMAVHSQLGMTEMFDLVKCCLQQCGVGLRGERRPLPENDGFPAVVFLPTTIFPPRRSGHNRFTLLRNLRPHSASERRVRGVGGALANWLVRPAIRNPLRSAACFRRVGLRRNRDEGGCASRTAASSSAAAVDTDAYAGARVAQPARRARQQPARHRRRRGCEGLTLPA